MHMLRSVENLDNKFCHSLLGWYKLMRQENTINIVTDIRESEIMCVLTQKILA